MKRFLNSLAIREMQIKNTVQSYHYIFTRNERKYRVVKDVEQKAFKNLTGVLLLHLTKLLVNIPLYG